MNRFSTSAVFLIAVSLLAGCNGMAQQGNLEHADDAQQHAQIFSGINHAVAVLTPTEGNETRGTVRFFEEGGQVRVVVEVSGLNPNQQHGFHIHEFGDMSSADGTAAGGHYNPEGHEHGRPNGNARHAGDFGNLTADDKGVARAEFTVNNITIAGLRNPILGRGLIVHRDPDDGSQPVGNAGPRLAQAVIGVAK